MSSSAPPRSRGTFARGDVLFGYGRRARDGEGRVRLRIVWARVLAACGVMMMVAWLGAGFAAWGLLRWRQKVETITLVDTLALPLRWKTIQSKRGDHYIEQGRKALDAGNYSAAFQLLRVGVFKSPANLEGRRRLAQIYALLVRRPDQGIKLLDEGMSYGGDNLDYLETYFALLFANQEDERVRELAAMRLAAALPGSRPSLIFGLAAAQACFFRGNYDGVEDFLKQARIERSVEGRLLQAQVEWERGYRELALSRLRDLVNGLSPPERAFELLFGYLRELKNADEARIVASLRKLKFPASLAARVGVLYAYEDGGDRAKIERELDSILGESGRDQRTLFALADFAVATANVGLADRIRELAGSTELAPEIGPIVAIEARIAASDYRGALSAMETISANKPEWLDAQSDTLAGFQAVAHFGLGQKDLGELYLGKYLDQKTPRAERLSTIARRLQKVGAPEAARRVLALAVETDAQNQTALTALVDLDLKSGRLDDLARNLDLLLAMRKPPLDLLQFAYQQLSVNRVSASPEHEPMLARLKTAIQAREGTGAL